MSLMADTFTERDIHVTLGALEIGVLVCMFMLGASTVQAYVYYDKFPLDPRRIKVLVSQSSCNFFVLYNS
jgi:hypothetical protein